MLNEDFAPLESYILAGDIDLVASDQNISGASLNMLIESEGHDSPRRNVGGAVCWICSNTRNVMRRAEVCLLIDVYCLE